MTKAEQLAQANMELMFTVFGWCIVGGVIAGVLLFLVVLVWGHMRELNFIRQPLDKLAPPITEAEVRKIVSDINQVAAQRLEQNQKIIRNTIEGN